MSDREIKYEPAAGWDGRHGYTAIYTIEYSLLERINLVLQSYSDEPRKRLLKHLHQNTETYRIDSTRELLQYVAFLDKPMALILDDLDIPRHHHVRKFHELPGPTKPWLSIAPYINRPITPGLIEAPKGFIKELTVQPMFRHIAELPIFARINVDGLKGLSE